MNELDGRLMCPSGLLVLAVRCLAELLLLLLLLLLAEVGVVGAFVGSGEVVVVEMGALLPLVVVVEVVGLSAEFLLIMLWWSLVLLDA